eukprot:1297163-Rhodomonas_salina.2
MASGMLMRPTLSLTSIAVWGWHIDICGAQLCARRVANSLAYPWHERLVEVVTDSVGTSCPPLATVRPAPTTNVTDA